MPRLPDTIEITPHDVADLADILIEAGTGDAVVEHRLAEWLDGLIAWERVVPGPIGVLLEAVDDDAAELLVRGGGAVVDAIRDLVRVDPEKRAARRARRLGRQAARAARRAERR